MLPFGSRVMPMGRLPVVPMMLEAPLEVIRETLPVFQLAV
jgi:hypothetical protein